MAETSAAECRLSFYGSLGNSIFSRASAVHHARPVADAFGCDCVTCCIDLKIDAFPDERSKTASAHCKAAGVWFGVMTSTTAQNRP